MWVFVDSQRTNKVESLCTLEGLYNKSMLQLVFVVLLGWIAGAIINYLADVLPIKRRLNPPFCLNCDASQGLSNYFFWPRRCRVCGERRTWRVWLVELAAIGAAAWIWFSPPPRLNFWASLALLIYFGVVVVIDMEYRLILHPVSAAGSILGFGTGIWLHGFKETIFGGIAGFGIMLLLYYFGALLIKIFRRWRTPHNSSPGEDDALGFGDVILSGVLGLILGWPGILSGLVLTILLGGVVSFLYILVMLITRRYRSTMALPYGPFLIASAVLILFFRGILY